MVTAEGGSVTGEWSRVQTVSQSQPSAVCCSRACACVLELWLVFDGGLREETEHFGLVYFQSSFCFCRFSRHHPLHL